ncbi:MAG: flagellar hook-basal body complex protein FliE [Calditrichaeota bacterium]|nr:flagellar hook-basal body complex protein FliE [Calditrichota bacterium]
MADNIIRLDQLHPPRLQPSEVRPLATPSPADQPGFGDVIKKLVSDVNSAQQSAETATNQMMTGELEDVHQVVVAMEEAQVSFRLLMEVRNRMVEAYKEVMRMQV